MTEDCPAASEGVGPTRWLPMEGCVNFRDLGGYATEEGRTTRWRRLYRSDALQDLTGEDADFVIRELGVRLVVDLRNSDESQRDGRGPLPDLGAEYRHFPLLEERGFPPFTGGDVVERLAGTYEWLVRNSGPRIAEAVNTISESMAVSEQLAQSGVVFHCSAGKDRTGMLAAIILEVLGVNRETIHSDYLLTNDVVEGILRRIKGMQPDATPTTQSLSAQPEAFRRFRETLHGEYGGAESYLREHGVKGSTLDTLRSHLLV